MHSVPPQPQSLALQELEPDLDQLRVNFSTTNPPPQLLRSIRRFGVLAPLLVLHHDTRRYLIIDGHYRYACAKTLGISFVPCLVYPKGSLRTADVARLRLDLHDLDQPWQDSDFYRWRQQAKPHLSPEELAEISDRFFTRYRDLN